MHVYTVRRKSQGLGPTDHLRKPRNTDRKVWDGPLPSLPCFALARRRIPLPAGPAPGGSDRRHHPRMPSTTVGIQNIPGRFRIQSRLKTVRTQQADTTRCSSPSLVYSVATIHTGLGWQTILAMMAPTACTPTSCLVLQGGRCEGSDVGAG